MSVMRRARGLPEMTPPAPNSPSLEIRVGDALEVMRTLEACSVQTCVTSSPYWGLRDYGVEGQMGIEATPELFVDALVAVLEEVRRLLRDDGTLWLNLGDGYASGGHGGGGSFMEMRGGDGSDASGAWDHRKERKGWRGPPPGLKPKDLVGIPWRVAFALQAAGWYLRSDIIWHKPNPMPESVRDRPTKAHEYIFLLSKSERYFYDEDAIKEPVSGTAHARGHGVNPKAKIPHGWDTGPGSHTGLTGRYKPKQNESWSAAVAGLVDMRKKRSVWTVASYPFPGAHFATFPPALVEPCILAGAREGDLVLDPFAGAGTVGVVCRKHRRRFLGIELNPEYARLARGRLGEDTTEEEGDDALPLFVESTR